jgi:hypothetical protein
MPTTSTICRLATLFVVAGKVGTPEARAAAEQAVRAVPGVTDLQNKLVVESPSR